MLGDTAKGGTVTSFARLGAQVFAREQSYGRGRPPHEVYEEGEAPLLGVLLKVGPFIFFPREKERSGC